MTLWMSAVNQHNKLIKDSPLNAIKITDKQFSAAGSFIANRPLLANTGTVRKSELL